MKQEEIEKRIINLETDVDFHYILIRTALFLFVPLFIFLISFYFAMTEVQTTTQRLEVGEGIYDYPASADISCEEGVEVIDYGNVQTIYGCLEFTKGYNVSGYVQCSGVGKVCLITMKKRVWK